MVFEGTIADVGIHVVTLIVASALFIVSVRAYRRKRNKKFLYVCGAFAVFAVKETLLTANIVLFGFPSVTGVTHLLNLVILGLFFYGVVR